MAAQQLGGGDSLGAMVAVAARQWRPVWQLCSSLAAAWQQHGIISNSTMAGSVSAMWWPQWQRRQQWQR